MASNIMTRAQFQIIADVVRATTLSPKGRRAIAREFADRLALTNDKFDRIKFLEACDPEGDYRPRGPSTSRDASTQRQHKAVAAARSSHGFTSREIATQDFEPDTDVCACSPCHPR